MPQTINFPERIDDDNSLYLVVNNLRTRLTSNIDDAVTTIPVVTTTGYPSVGFVTILTGADITKAEAVAYSGTDDTNFFNAERGSDETPALQHFTNDNVDFTITARHHNNVKDAIIELEKFVGVSGSENFVPFQDGGNVVLPGTLSVEETLVVSGGATFCFITVTGTADFQDNVTVTGNITVGDGGTIVTPNLAVSDTATVSGIPIMINVPADIDVNTIHAECIDTTKLTVTGTAFNLDEFGNLAVSGTFTVCDDADFKTDVTISGCLQVGEFPVSSTPEATFQFVDTVFTTTQNTTYDDTGVSIVPDSGVNLLLYRASSSASSAGAAVTGLRALYAGTELGASDGSNESATGGHWNSTDFAGFKVVTTNAVDVLKLQGKSLASNREADVGSQQLISVPLETLGLVEETDYWFDNGSESNFLIPLASGTDIVTVNSFDITVPVTGPYLLIGGADTQMALAAAVGQYAVYVYANETNVSNHMVRDANTLSFYHTNSWFQVINLTAGANNISIRSRRWNGIGALNLKRARLCLINGSSFDSMTGTRTFTDTDTSSSTFTEITQLAQTHTPSEIGQVLVFGSSNSRSFDVVAPEAVPTFKIRDDTDGVDYAEDFGEGMTSAGGGITTIHSNAFAIKDDALNPTNWKMFVREANATGNQVRSNHSSLVVWSLIAPTEAAIELTTIKKDKIITPCIDVEVINVINNGTLSVEVGGSMTISGEPVATGTSGGGGGASTLQEAYDNGDGTILTTEGKPLELTGKGEFVAVTGTFSKSLTISGEPVATGTETRVNGLTGSVILQGASDGSVTITADGQVLTFSGTSIAEDGGGGGDPSCFIHTQSSADTAWVVTHNLGTEAVNYITLDTADSQVDPDSFTIDTQDQVTITFAVAQDGTAIIFPCGGQTTLQQAYDNSDTGNIVTVPGKPIVISGTEEDDDVDFIVVGSGIFTEALTIGQGSTTINDHSVTTASGVFEFLTVSGSPVDSGGVPDPLAIGTINVSTSLTVSGIPVDTTGGGGGGGAALTVKEADGAPSVANVDTIVVSDGTLTDDGGGQVTIQTGGTGGGGGTTSGTIEFRGVLLTTSSGVNVTDPTPGDSGNVSIPWNVTRYDTDNFHDAAGDSPNLITVPEGVTKMKFFSQVAWLETPATKVSGSRVTVLRRVLPAGSSKNIGVSDDSANLSTVDQTIVQCASPVITVSGGEAYDCFVFYQDAGSDGPFTLQTGDVNTVFAAEVVEPVTVTGIEGGGSSVGQFTQAFTDQTSISVAHNVGSLVHFTTVLDESNFVVDAQIQYGENTDEVTLSELMSGSVVVLG